jgi:hypothetical protein
MLEVSANIHISLTFFFTKVMHFLPFSLNRKKQVISSN